jgi:biopolymer transport protein ExbD
MRRIRRTSPEPRMEMTPLLDVVFLLLTFFVFALLLMVRADVLNVALPALGAAQPAAGANTITITIDEAGAAYIDGDAVPIDDIAPQTAARLAENPEARLLIAVDTRSRSATLMQVVNNLVAARITDFALLGRTPEEPAAQPPPSPQNENAPAETGAP